MQQQPNSACNYLAATQHCNACVALLLCCRLEGIKDVPLAVLAPALGVAFNAVKALVPY
jgi:hypothetical protein